MTFIKLMIMTLFLWSVTAQADDKETVYMYKNDKGDIEFTDMPKTDKAPVKQRDYKKMTEQEKQQGQQKLDKIIADDKALDERLAKEQKEKEAKQRQRKAQAELKEIPGEVESQNNNYYPNGRIVNPRPLPVRPTPLPARPRPR